MEIIRGEGEDLIDDGPSNADVAGGTPGRTVGEEGGVVLQNS